MRRTKLKSSGKGLKRTPLKPTESPKKSGFKKKPLKNKSIELKKEASKKKHLVQKKKRNLRRKQIRKSSSNPLSREIKLCDLSFSQYVRLLNAEPDGRVQCFTCAYKANWAKAGIQCSHFKSRGCFSTRWLKLNCEPGCINCNEFLSGNLAVFAERLVAKHGKGIIEYLEKESKRTVKLDINKVRKLREYFQAEVQRLKIKLNL